MPPAIFVTEATSVKRSPSKSCGSGSWAASTAIPAAARWIALSANHGRAEWPATPWKLQVALMLPRQPAWIALSVGSIITTSSGCERVAREQRGQRALGERQLLAAEEQGAERRAVAHELDHHRERALHVARAEAVDGLGVAAAGPVALGRDGVEVAAEQHARALRAGQHAGVAEVARVRQQAAHMVGEPRLVTGLRGDVDQLERPGGEALAQLGVSRGP